MAVAVQQSTPGVYINEINAFPNSVVAVATAIPLFIGYTVSAEYKGLNYLNKAVNIGSLQDFLNYFGPPPQTPGNPPPPALDTYFPVASKGDGDVVLDGEPFDLVPDPTSIYYLYSAVRHFYQAGGGSAIVISCGIIQPPTGKQGTAGADLINPNVQLADLQAALNLGLQEPDATMILIPDGLLLPEADYAELMTDMLAQCYNTGSRVALFDVWGGYQPNLDTDDWQALITNFRDDVGMNYLNYGIAYFPFLNTAIVQPSEINYNNLGGAKALMAALPDASTPPVQTYLAQIQSPPASNAPTPLMLENALRAQSTYYPLLQAAVLARINTLPASPAMAGLYTMVDNASGVWQAPANVSVPAVVSPNCKISDTDQQTLNVDPLTGKSVNAIRQFTGMGTMVWGARTLDGNSQDWRYVNVRRTVIMIEQSIKLALRAYVFAPNTAATWSLIQTMLTSFLTTMWNAGALAGGSAAEAFAVSCGLGVTMTPDDILNGNLNVTVKIAVSHPAEFIIVTFQQQQQGA